MYLLLNGNKLDYSSNVVGTPLIVNNDKSDKDEAVVASTTAVRYKYFEVVNSCDTAFIGECVNVRSAPTVESKVIIRLRNGVVLRVADTVVNDEGTWYKIDFVHGLLYKDRFPDDWYVRADLVNMFEDDGDNLLKKGEVYEGNKKIVVDVSKQRLYAYEGDVVFMDEAISTGLEFTPTPRGRFTIFKMTPSRFMQGPLPGVSSQAYDLPGVPWDLYFTADGAVIHGTYWHDKFGTPWSHGCVNLPPEKAKQLYMWSEVGVEVVVQN